MERLNWKERMLESKGTQGGRVKEERAEGEEREGGG